MAILAGFLALLANQPMVANNDNRSNSEVDSELNISPMIAI
jgi:hypothetical protein